MRSLEVCAGIGGLTLGLEMAGFQCAGLVEIDARCRAHLREKWPHVPVFADMRALSDDDLRRVGPVDLLAGGIPCQPHSVAGKRLGHGDERDLWPDFLALALRLGAKALLVENVRGLASSPGGLDRIARDLEASGYCWWVTTLRAADVGAPHLRDRLFICAMAEPECGPPQRRGELGELRGSPSDAQGPRDQWERGRDAAPGDGDDGPGRLADPNREGPQGRWRPAAGLQREAAERGGEVGDAEIGRRCMPSGSHHGSESGGSSWQDRGSSPWSDARAISCRDGKARIIPTELALFPVAHGAPGRVARLRALGNAVVPLQAYVPARALYEVMTSP